MSNLPRAARPLQLVDHVVGLLRAKYADGKVGDKIPTEMALTQEFGVSRTTIREAIMVLKSEGLLETRQGSGIFVAEPPRNNVFQLQLPASPSREATTALFEFRSAIEAAAAELAATRRTKQDLRALNEALKNMIDPGTRAAADYQFHLAIAEATQNQNFLEFIRYIDGKLFTFLAVAVGNTLRQHPDRVAAVMQEHKDIADAVRGRDAAGAGEAMRRHLLASAQRMHVVLRDPRQS